jgi:cytochrome c peroxidase
MNNFKFLKISSAIVAIAFCLSILLVQPSDAITANYDNLIDQGLVDAVKTPQELGLNYLSQQPVQLGNAIPYLSIQLKYILNNVAPNNQKVAYFMLPESSNLQQIPADKKNPITPEKVNLGKLLFHETALSINPINSEYWQQTSCASCHFAQAGFRSNLAQGLGSGGLGWNKSRHRDPQTPPSEIDKQNILTPSVLNSTYQDVMLWDGRAGVVGVNGKEPLIQEFDINRFQLNGLETQAIDGMNVHRMGTAAIAKIPEY